MTILNLFFAVLLILTAAVFAVIALRIAPRIREAAGYRKLLDERIDGYDFEEAKAFLGALTPEAAKTYLKMATQWDMILALLYGAVLCLAIQCATPEAFPVPPFVMALIGLPVVLCDMREKAYVAGMLIGGPDELTPDLVARASFWTRWKWRLLFLGCAVFVLMAILRVLWPASGGTAA